MPPSATFALPSTAIAIDSAAPSRLSARLAEALTWAGFGIIFADTPPSLSALVAIMVSAFDEKNRTISAIASHFEPFTSSSSPAATSFSSPTRATACCVRADISAARVSITTMSPRISALSADAASSFSETPRAVATPPRVNGSPVSVAADDDDRELLRRRAHLTAARDEPPTDPVHDRERDREPEQDPDQPPGQQRGERVALDVAERRERDAEPARRDDFHLIVADRLDAHEVLDPAFAVDAVVRLLHVGDALGGGVVDETRSVAARDRAGDQLALEDHRRAAAERMRGLIDHVVVMVDDDPAVDRADRALVGVGDRHRRDDAEAFDQAFATRRRRLDLRLEQLGVELVVTELRGGTDRLARERAPHERRAELRPGSAAGRARDDVAVRIDDGEEREPALVRDPLQRAAQILRVRRGAAPDRVVDRGLFDH